MLSLDVSRRDRRLRSALKRQLIPLLTAINKPCPDQLCYSFVEKIDSGDEQATTLLHQVWPLLEARVAQLVASHASTNEIQTAVGHLGPFKASILTFDPSTLFVTLIYDDSVFEGFVISRSSVSWHVIWRLQDLPDLTVGRLPDTNDGHHRFDVIWTHFQEAGCDFTNTLSIYRVEATTVRELLAKAYPTSCSEEDNPPRLAERILHVPVKREYKALWAGASEAGREMDWRIRVASNGVKDLGETPTEPLLDAIDELFHRLFRGLSATDLASEQAIANLKPVASRLVEDQTAAIAAKRANVPGGKLRPNELEDFSFLGDTITRPDRSEGKSICFEVSAWNQGGKAFIRCSND